MVSPVQPAPSLTPANLPRTKKSALFNFHSLLLVLLLLICTSTYAHATFPGPLDRHRHGPLGLFWKCARIGERLSPWVSAACVVMAVRLSISPFLLLLVVCSFVCFRSSVCFGCCDLSREDVWRGECWRTDGYGGLGLDPARRMSVGASLSAGAGTGMGRRVQGGVYGCEW